MDRFANLSRRSALGLAAGALACAGLAPLAGCSSRKTYRAALVISGPVQDKGWGQSHYDAVTAACKELGNWQLVEPEENTSAAASADLAQSYVDQGVDLIIGAGVQFARAWGDVVSSAAKKRPDVKFLFTNIDPAEDLPNYRTLENVRAIEVDRAQFASMAGVVAGLVTRTNKIGYVAGATLSSTTEKYAAFVEAARKVNPEAEAVSAFDVGFTDEEAGRSAAARLIGSGGVDVIWSEASTADNGVRQALSDAGADGHFNIAQPRDLAGEPAVVASTVIDWPILEAMKAVADGSYGGGAVIVADLANGGIGLGKLSDAVPDDVREKIEAFVAQIEDGSF